MKKNYFNKNYFVCNNKYNNNSFTSLNLLTILSFTPSMHIANEEVISLSVL